MKIKDLRYLLEKHNNIRSKLLEIAINQYYLEAKPDTDITFSSISKTLRFSGIEITQPNGWISKISSDENIFYLFITGKAKPRSSNRLLGKLPAEIIADEIASYLDDVSLAKSSVCSRGMFITTTSGFFWKSKFLDLDIKPETVNQLIKINWISNFAKVYNSIQYRYDDFLEQAEVWELLLATGDLDIIAKTIDIYNLTSKTINCRGENPMHIVSEINAVEPIRFIIKKLKPEIYATNFNGMDVMHIAASAGATKVILFLKKEFNFNLYWPDNEGLTVIHHAAQSGNLDTLKLIVEKFRIPLDLSTKKGNFTVLHHAIASGSLEVVKYITLDPYFDFDDLLLTSDCGLNILHLAGYSGSIDVIEYVMHLNHKYSLNFDAIETRDDTGTNAIWYAKIGHSDNPNEAIDALILNHEENQNQSDLDNYRIQRSASI